MFAWHFHARRKLCHLFNDKQACPQDLHLPKAHSCHNCIIRRTSKVLHSLAGLLGHLVINSSVGFMICHWFAEALGNRCNLSNLHCFTTLRTSNTLQSNFKIYRNTGLKPSQVRLFFVPSILRRQPFKLFLLFQCSLPCHCQSLHPSELFRSLPLPGCSPSKSSET